MQPTTSPYPPQFVARRKGQRYAKGALPALFLCALPAGYSVQLLGTAPGVGGFGQPVTWQYLIVTTPTGLQVPAYKQAGQGWVVCQNSGYYPVQG